MALIRIAVLLIASAFLFACSEDKNAAPSINGGGGTGGAGGTTTGSGGVHAGGQPCIQGFGDSTQEATYDTADNFTNVIANTMGADFDSLALQLFYDLGADVMPHTFTFTGENYADCHTCLLLYQSCDATEMCVGVFIVEEGSLEVTANGTVADETFSATLSDALLVEASIDGNTFESTRVTNGLTWCIDTFTFDATIALTP